MICFLLAFVATFPYAKSWNQHLRVALFPPYKKGVSGEKFGLLGWFVCSMYLAVRVHNIVNPECNTIDGQKLTTS
jgi:hypothetical protein